ncbi:MAG: tetratricopeptide repeat protein [Chloroflexi bacterium]|jgi:tetratricopeptide (TPR) repeat protein|nr:tetratricopeptide repeat protein [Chloroflexota bacterium]MDL1882169.1 tetratricopeptide repeat protein [Anaerolineae bacterium CFX8]
MTTAQELQERGVKLFQQKDFEAAAQHFQQAMDAYEAEGRRDIAAEMQVNIGLVHRALGENQQALEAMQAALGVFQETGDAVRTAKVLGNMGGVYVELNDHEQAYNCYRQAADIFEAQGEKKLYGETLMAIGALQVDERKLMQGAATYEVGLEQLGELTPRQKMIKGLLGIRNKLSGGNK